MPGLVPGIHVLTVLPRQRRGWPGQARTSPAMTTNQQNESQLMSVRIVDVSEVTKPISSPIRNAYIDFTKMTTSLVTDAKRDGKRVVGYGFNSNGRYGQGGLIRERFAPRLTEADPKSLLNEAGD